MPNHSENSMPAVPVIEVEAVTRTLKLDRRELRVLRGLSFQIAAGEWVALTGPSGSGKSTLLGVLAGIDRPTSGRVCVAGVEISALPVSMLARLRNATIGIILH